MNVDVVQVAVEYAAFHAKGGLTFEGLQQTYEDGIGDVDIDYETLGLDEPVSILQLHPQTSVSKTMVLNWIRIADRRRPCSCIDSGEQECPLSLTF